MISSDKAFDNALWPISGRLKGVLSAVDGTIKSSTYEIRLRANRPVVLYGAYASVFLGKNAQIEKSASESTYICSVQELTETFNRLCGYSIHTHQFSINNGFVTMKGGHRVGIAGTAVCNSDGEIVNIRDVSSLNIRISRQQTGCSNEIFGKLFSVGSKSVIIAGPPSSGKTTVIRDLARKLSSGEGCEMRKVVVIDEREEIASCESAIPCNDIGLNCDVLNSYPKDLAILTAIKTLSPEIIVCDEIATASEVNAIRHAVNTGVRFVVTIHASDFDELVSRPQIESLLDTYSFDDVVVLAGGGQPCTVKNIYDSRELRDEIYRRRSGLSGYDGFGN